MPRHEYGWFERCPTARSHARRFCATTGQSGSEPKQRLGGRSCSAGRRLSAAAETAVAVRQRNGVDDARPSGQLPAANDEKAADAVTAAAGARRIGPDNARTHRH